MLSRRRKLFALVGKRTGGNNLSLKQVAPKEEEEEEGEAAEDEAVFGLRRHRVGAKAVLLVLREACDGSGSGCEHSLLRQTLRAAPR